MKSRVTVVLMLLVFVGIVFSAHAEVHALSSETELLLKLLEKKQVITEGEADELKKEIETAAPEEPEVSDREKLKEEIKAEIESEKPWKFDNLIPYGIDIHGMVSQGYINSDHYNYLAHDSEGGSFQFNEYALNFSKNLTDRLRVGIQLFARDLGDMGNDDIYVDWAYGDYRWKDWLGFRAGKMKVPFGLYNETRDMDMLRTFVFLPSGVYTETYRDILMGLKGISIYGTLPLKKWGSLDYQALYGTMDLDDSDAFEKVYLDMLPPGSSLERIDVDEVFTACYRWNTPIDGLRIGSTFSYQDFDIRAEMRLLGPFTLDGLFKFKDIEAFTHSIEYTWGNLVLATEYFELSVKSTPYINRKRLPKESMKMEGWYVSGTYRFTDWLEVGAYYSMFWPDAHDRGGHDESRNLQKKHQAWLEDIALAFRFDINKYMIFKTEWHWMDGTANVYGLDNPGGYHEQDWFYFTSKLTFHF